MNFLKILKQIETTDFSFQEVGIISSAVLIAGLVISNVWSVPVFALFWLTLVSCWIYLHIKKSKYTWQRFDDIDERDIEYKDEFELRVEKLEQRVSELAHSLQTKDK